MLRWYKNLSKSQRMAFLITAVFIIIIAIFTVSVLALMNLRLMQEKPVTENSDANSTEIVSQQYTDVTIKDKSVNFLVVGLDESESLTDVIMIVNYDIEQNKVSILQIPRDSFIGDDYITGKINSVYGHAPVGQTKIGALIQVVNEQFKLPIDHYVTVTLEGFRNAVDDMGGVEIDLPQAIYYLPGKTLQPGLQTLDGEKAEWFIRYRAGYTTGDIGRMEARALFIKALAQKASKLSVTSAVSLATTMYSEVTTDLSLKEILAYVNLAMGMDFDNIYTEIVPGNGVMHNSFAVYGIDAEETADILNEHFRPYSDKVDAEDLEIAEVINPPAVSSQPVYSQPASSQEQQPEGNGEAASSEPVSSDESSSSSKKDRNRNKDKDTDSSSEKDDFKETSSEESRENGE